MKNKFSFLTVRYVPTLFWSSPKSLTITPPAISVFFLILGLIIFGLGEALLIVAGVGVSPWTVFAQGINQVTGWSVGFATFIISSFVLVLWIPLRQIPGLGTLFNAVIIAAVLEYSLPYLPTFDQYSLQILEAAIGVILTGFGSGLYLIAKLGPGPRDGLMTGLQRLTDFPIIWVRGAIELTVVLSGWCLGGVVGIGTILFAFGIGPCVAASLYFLQLSCGNSKQSA